MNIITKIVSRNKDKNFFWRVLHRILSSIYFFTIGLIPTKIYIKALYLKKFRRRLNLKDPQTLNEKLQWLKIYDKKPFYRICADKYAVRNYVKEKIGEKHLIPLLVVADKPEEIDFDKIPLPYIIKPNHCSGHYIIVKGKEDINKREFIKKCKRWLKIDYYSYSKEWQYKGIPRKIVIEKLLLDKRGQIPNDYKFNVFNGKIEFIEVHTSKFRKYKNVYFTKNWRLLPFVWCNPDKMKDAQYKMDRDIPRPKNIGKMVKIVEKLSKDFKDYIRIDLYSVKNEIYFGEITFHQAGGFERFFPDKYDLIYGKKLKLKYFKKDD